MNLFYYFLIQHYYLLLHQFVCVCEFVCLCERKRVCLFVCEIESLCVFVYLYAFVCVSACVREKERVCVCVCVSACLCERERQSVCVWVCVCVHARCWLAFKWNVIAKWTTTRAGHVEYFSAFRQVSSDERTEDWRGKKAEWGITKRERERGENWQIPNLKSDLVKNVKNVKTLTTLFAKPISVRRKT